MLKKGENPNHPKKGASIMVDPIRDLKAINKIKRLLKKTSPRDYLLFVLGINNGLRISDLLNLKVEQVIDLEPGEILTIKEKKTGKKNILMINKAVYEALELYLGAVELKDSDPLFKSLKGKKAITTPAASNLIKKWTTKAGLRGNFASHTLRKTFGYIQRTQFGVSFEILCKRFNHSNPAVTMRYLGIEDREVSEILLHEI
jgi:integrase